jgi:hypothetical protein
MRTAIRGDFDRLAERRGGQELMRPPAEEPEAPSEPQPFGEPVVEELPCRSWLARLLGK